MQENFKNNATMTMLNVLLTDSPLPTDWKQLVDVATTSPQTDTFLYLDCGNQEIVFRSTLPTDLLTQIPLIPLFPPTGMTFEIAFSSSQSLIRTEIRYNVSHLNISTNG